MARKRSKRRKDRQLALNLPVVISISVIFSVYLIITFLQGKGWDGWIPDWDRLFGELTSTQTLKPTPTPEGDLLVHYIDIGQGDSMLIQAGDANILIDAGDNGTRDQLLEYLKPLNLDEIDLMIASHPHADHIGGADAVLNAYTVREFWMSDIPDALVPTTRTFEDVLDGLEQQDLTITIPKIGEQKEIGGGVMEVLGPVADYDDLNNCSLITRYTYGETSFLFTGDMEEKAEKDLLTAKTNLAANVLKMGHHGSSTSSSRAFVEAVGAKYYVISCGTDNKYGHPHRETLDMLNELDKPFYRTDRNGTVIFVSDGKTLSIKVSK